ncbi:ATP-NAD kinase family protein [Reinekea marina]|uniref:ATP-NAD kinase family protein n=1 Tax=Reinekea marina TaxID=1310421 RepID=A0ABV7WVB4_9GAMM|nr:ATP-NAD kinase family protein [Reinekea marina]MDN3648764.1 ATP-NAD kinase family protein [Reinekea marina]
MKIGFIVNPWSGIGGSVALKGSDGKTIREQAIKLGATQKAMAKASVMIETFLAQSNHQTHSWFSAQGDLGGSILKQYDIEPLSLYPEELPDQTESQDTRNIVAWLVSCGVDIIVFAGGDGTARDVCSVVQDHIPVIGIPAGVKIHSGVFAVTPHAAGEVMAGLVQGHLTDLRLEEVRDIDEDAFRENRVASKYYGEMKVPVSAQFMQHVKVGGIEQEDLVLNDIAEWLDETSESEVVYLMGSGKTIDFLMQQVGVSNTLLGVDAVLNRTLLKADCTEQDILAILKTHKVKLVISIIGGQGHIFGRGNHQFSPKVLKTVGKANVIVIGTKAKLRSLEGRPLIIDSGDRALDLEWTGLITLLTGYNDEVLYPLVSQ